MRLLVLVLYLNLKYKTRHIKQIYLKSKKSSQPSPRKGFQKVSLTFICRTDVLFFISHPLCAVDGISSVTQIKMLKKCS